MTMSELKEAFSRFDQMDVNNRPKLPHISRRCYIQTAKRHIQEAQVSDGPSKEEKKKLDVSRIYDASLDHVGPD